MPSSRTDFACSNAPIATKGEVVMKTMTALLITAAAAMILVRASGWADLPVNDFDLLLALH
jgi:hypothetical protein